MAAQPDSLQGELRQRVAAGQNARAEHADYSTGAYSPSEIRALLWAFYSRINPGRNSLPVVTFRTFRVSCDKKSSPVFATMLLIYFFFLSERLAQVDAIVAEMETRIAAQSGLCFLFACILRLHLNTHVPARRSC
jgi:hypothetical protein